MKPNWGTIVYGEDPTLNALEAKAAERLGKEAAVFVASGTMGNLVSVLSHAQRGDEIILGNKAHIFRSEAGGASALGGVSFHTIPNDDRGMLDTDDIQAAVRPNDPHMPRTALVCLENTQNMCGGATLTQDDMKSVADVAHANGIPVHVDGARIFNAAVALEAPVSELVKDVDSVTFCLSKGLSCPIGSIIVGSEDYILEARRVAQDGRRQHEAGGRYRRGRPGRAGQHGREARGGATRTRASWRMDWRRYPG